MAYEEEWEVSSGLPLDGATATITAFEWGMNANIGAGVVCGNVTFTTDEGEDIEQSFSVGQAGEPSKDGSVLEGTGRWGDRSNMGRLINSAKELLSDPGEQLGNPRLASSWIGSKWTLGTVEVETTNPTTQEKKVKNAFVFTAFHGKEGKGASAKQRPPAKTSAAKKAPTKAAPADDEADDDETNGIPTTLWDQLVTLAGEHDDHESFMDAALELDEVTANKVAQKLVYGTKAGSIWATAQAA